MKTSPQAHLSGHCSKQSRKTTKLVVLYSSEAGGCSDYPKWGPALPSLALVVHHGGTSFTPITKKKKGISFAAKQCRKVFAHSEAVGVTRKASVGDGCGPVFIFLSPSAAVSHSECSTTSPFRPPVGPFLIPFYPHPAAFQKQALSDRLCTRKSLYCRIVYSHTRFLLHCSRAASSVGLSLNSAVLNASTWLHVHKPTLIAT